MATDKRLKKQLDQEKDLPKVKTKELAKTKLSSKYNTRLKTQPNPNGKEDFDTLLKKMVTPQGD